MKNKKAMAIIGLMILLLLSGCASEPTTNESVIEEDHLAAEPADELPEVEQGRATTPAEQVEDVPVIEQAEGLHNNQPEQLTTVNEQEAFSEFFSPFTGLPINKLILDRVVMVSIGNSIMARPQEGLAEAELVYEFLVEGGVTRLLALYWGDIPDKIGPVRSVRPYIIETALEFDALLLHAGACPAGFELLERRQAEHLDQIFNSRYYWRSNERKPPYNLYTGNYKFSPYLKKLTGQEYKTRFPFQRISFINANDLKANKIKINYWGNYRVYYRYDPDKNIYYRYISDQEQPHYDGNGSQLNTRNLIVQYAATRVIDSVGRLSIDLNSTGKALIFKDGIVKGGYWEKPADDWTKFYGQDGQEIRLNPGKTWIQVVPDSTKVDFKE